MQNDGIRFADDFKTWPEAIPQFSIFNFQFSITKIQGGYYL